MKLGTKVMAMVFAMLLAFGPSLATTAAGDSAYAYTSTSELGAHSADALDSVAGNTSHAFDPSITTSGGWGGDRATLQAIFGSDERVRISPTSSYPASALTFLLILDSSRNVVASCSGTMVGPQVVLTAGHCVYDPTTGSFVAGVVAVPGADLSSTGNPITPFGMLPASDVQVTKGWAAGDWNYDAALLKLSSPVGNATGWFRVGALTTATLQSPSLQFAVDGYPGDKPAGTQWASAKTGLLGVDDTELYTDLDLAHGESGASAWLGSDGTIIGIVSHELSQANVLTRITQATITSFLTQSCQQMNCTFASYIEPDGSSAPPSPSPSPTPIGTAA